VKPVREKKPEYARVARHIKELVPYVPGKPIEELEWELGIKDSIKIASNENPLGPSPKAVRAVRAALKNLNRYPDGNATLLKRRLAKKLKVPQDMIMVGNGSNEILELLVATFMVPGDQAIMSEHAFIVYNLAVTSRGLKKIVVPAGKNFGHDLKAIKRAVNSRTRIIFLANPNNPTGTYFTGKELEGLLKGLPSRVLVVMDEAYFEYVRKKDYPNSVNMIKKGAPVVAVRTFSKIYGLAGLRIGYGVAHPEITQYVNRVRQPFNTNMLAQIAATAALDDDRHVKRTLEINHKGMAYLEEKFKKLGINYIPSVGNFIIFQPPGPPPEVYNKLLHKGVIVRPIGGYKLPDWLRVTVGTPAENRRFISALKELL
jgi:histidinol-phosphate aminotransferase